MQHINLFSTHIFLIQEQRLNERHYFEGKENGEHFTENETKSK